MKNYSPRQKNFTPPSVQPKRMNVITPKTRDTKEEYYCGTRCDTFLPSVSDLPLPPTEWIDPTRSKSTPTSPVPAKPCITATKSIDIAAIFGSAPSAAPAPLPVENKVWNKTRKSSSYPGEKPKRFEENGARNNNNNKRQMSKEARPQVVKTATAAPQKTTSNPTAAVTSFTSVKSPTPTEKEISADLMKMLGVTPVKSPQKIASPGCMPRTGSPQKYQEITNNLKSLLKVQA